MGPIPISLVKKQDRISLLLNLGTLFLNLGTDNGTNINNEGGIIDEEETQNVLNNGKYSLPYFFCLFILNF